MHAMEHRPADIEKYSNKLVKCSTNMAIADAACLGRALEDNPQDLHFALRQYNQARVPATRREVMAFQAPACLLTGGELALCATYQHLCMRAASKIPFG